MPIPLLLQLFPLKIVSLDRLQPWGRRLSMSPCHPGSHRRGPKSIRDENQIYTNHSEAENLIILEDISALRVVNGKHMTTRHEGGLKVSQLELFQRKHELLLFLLRKTMLIRRVQFVICFFSPPHPCTRRGSLMTRQTSTPCCWLCPSWCPSSGWTCSPFWLPAVSSYQPFAHYSRTLAWFVTFPSFFPEVSSFWLALDALDITNMKFKNKGIQIFKILTLQIQ